MTPLPDPFQEIQERVERATPGPWDYNLSGIWAEVWRADEDAPWVSLADDPSLPVTSITGPHKYAPPAEDWHQNADFIAHSRQDIPLLLQALTEALGALENYADEDCWMESEEFDQPDVHWFGADGTGKGYDIARQAITRISQMGVKP